MPAWVWASLCNTPQAQLFPRPARTRHPCEMMICFFENGVSRGRAQNPPVLVKCGMEEVEDTPIFQERVTYLEGQSKAIKAEVKLLIGQAHAFAHAGVQYAEAGKAFAAKADELGAVMPALQSVGAGLKELFKLVEIMSQKQNELTQPLEQLCAQIKQV